jgi:hypothetical protein
VSSVRFRFDAGINAEAQRVLAGLFGKLAHSLDGVTDCSVSFERASGEWVARIAAKGEPLRIGDDSAGGIPQLRAVWQREERS